MRSRSVLLVVGAVATCVTLASEPPQGRLAEKAAAAYKPSPIVGTWNATDRHVSIGSLYQPVHGVRKREATVHFAEAKDGLAGYSVTEHHKAISFQERWKDGRTKFSKVAFADDQLTFEFEIDEWRLEAGPIAVEQRQVKNGGTIRVEARLKGDRLVGKWSMLLKDGSEAFRGEWEAERAKPVEKK